MTIPDDNKLLDELTDLFDTARNIDPLERSRRIALLGDQLRNCLRELDALGLFQAGSHLDMTLHAIEKDREPKYPAFAPNRSLLH